MRYSASASSIQQSSNKTSSICPTRSDQNQHFHLNPADFQSWMIPFHSIQLSRHLFIIFQEFLFVLVYFFLFLSLSFFFLFEQTEEEGAGGVKCGWGKREREGERERVSTCVRSIRIPAANAADGNAAARSLPDLLCVICMCDRALHVATSDALEIELCCQKWFTGRRNRPPPFKQEAKKERKKER